MSSTTVMRTYVNRDLNHFVKGIYISYFLRFAVGRVVLFSIFKFARETVDFRRSRKAVLAALFSQEQTVASSQIRK